MLGQTLADKYVLERLLGEGGMGAVYQARNNATGRRVAVKIITAEGAKGATVAKRFAIEARAAGAVESVYIAQILDAGEDTERNIPFIVMEYLVGEDLDQLLTRLGPLPQALVVKLGAQICLGLAKAHAAGVVHRDVKPANIFVAERDGGERGVKLVDFGVAKVKMEVAQDDAKLTHSGSLVGSPMYMSPEQARGRSGIDHATDIWSLGVVLYQALSGRSPHEDASGIGDLIIAICSDPPGSVQRVAPWVSTKLASIIARALMMDPRERFASADEMYAALRSLSPDSIAVSDAALVPVSGNERMRLGEPALGPWIPTGEEFPREEVTATRPALLRPSSPGAVGLATTAAVHVEAEPTMPLPTASLLDTTGSELPTVVRPNELLGPLQTVPIPKDINLPPLDPPAVSTPDPLPQVSPPPASRPSSALIGRPAHRPSRVPIIVATAIVSLITVAAWLLVR